MTANAIRVWRRADDTRPLLLMIGGMICVFLEPLVDVLGNCWYPRGSQFEIFELMGRPMPFLVLPGYTFFMGGLTVIALHTLRTAGPGGLRRAYPLMILLELPFEWVAVQTGVYSYYGQQPLEIWDFPIWWLFVNTLVPVVSAVIIHRSGDYFSGTRSWLVIPLLPAVDAGVNVATSWPTWTVLHSDVPVGVTQLAGVLTVGLCLGGLWLLTEKRDTPATRAVEQTGSNR